MKQRPDDSRGTAEIAELRHLLHALAAQVDGLTRENAALRAENQQLKSLPSGLTRRTRSPGSSACRRARPSRRRAWRKRAARRRRRLPNAAGAAPSRTRRRASSSLGSSPRAGCQGGAPAGSRFKGYATLLVRELPLTAEVIAYSRERWLTPQGKMLVAPTPAGIVGGFGPNLGRFCWVMHAQGQVTTERLAAILNGAVVAISKRQVVRLLTGGLDVFIAEDQAAPKAGLTTAPFITVDDTGARHQRRDAGATQIGGDRFTVFRTGRSKSRRNFLSLLRAGSDAYVVNDEALAFMRRSGVETAICERLRRHPCKTFAGEQAWLMHLAGLCVDIFDRALVRALTEGALWGAAPAQGLMPDTVVVSDAAGQFRVADHALCWVHSERLLHKLMPATARQEKAVKTVRDRVGSFYRALKRWKAQPVPEAVRLLAACFDKMLTLHTGFPDLDWLLARLHRRKASLRRVLERPDIPLHTNASENDLRACVTKRKISGGRMSAEGRQARDVMLGLMKTCRKLDLSFFATLGARLGCSHSADPPPPLAGPSPAPLRSAARR